MISSGSPHVLRAHVGRTCGEPDEIGLTAIGVKLNGSREGGVRRVGGLAAVKLLCLCQRLLRVQCPAELGKRRPFLYQAPGGAMQARGVWCHRPCHVAMPTPLHSCTVKGASAEFEAIVTIITSHTRQDQSTKRRRERYGWPGMKSSMQWRAPYHKGRMSRAGC